MDEPLAALDQRRKQEILPFLTRLHHELEIPVIYVTHAIEEVTQLADYLVLMEKGKVLASGLLEDTLTQLDSPLARDREASTVLQVTVCGHEPEYHLTQVNFAGGIMRLPSLQTMVVGTSIRLRIYAKDISLSLQLPEQTSILNVLPASIVGMSYGEEGQTLVRLELEGIILLAHITRKSAIELGLREGMQVYAQIKATAIEG
jgi:molybdate transport system ATP-binding protein